MTAAGDPTARRRRKGDGAKLPDGRWMVRAVVNGRPRAFTGKTQAEAKQKAQKARLAATETEPATAMTVEEFLTEHVRETKLSLKATSWRKPEVVFRRHVIPRIGRLPLTSVTERTLAELYASLKPALGPRSLHHVHVILGTALESARRRRLIAVNPARNLKAPRAVVTRRDIWTREQCDAFLNAAAGDPFYAFFVVALTAGMRPGEVMALHWRDVDMEKRQIHVRWNAIDGFEGRELAEPKTERARRTIDVPTRTVEALAARRPARARDGDLVFPGQDGKLLAAGTILRSHFYPIVDRAGLPRIPLYALRDMHATLLLEQGVPIDVVSARLGHANVATTLTHYAHVTQRRQDQAVQAMEAVFG
jgi:integrase